MNKSFANSLTAISIALASLTALAFMAQPLPNAAVVQTTQQTEASIDQHTEHTETRTALEVIEDERDELARRAMIRAGTGLHFFNTRLYDTEATPSTVSQ